MVVDVPPGWDLLNALREKPYVVLKINDKPTEFLCDSGACKTVLKTHVPGLKQSQNKFGLNQQMDKLIKNIFLKR